MKIGIPKEVKPNENRVAITPSGVMEFVKCGHEVYIQDGAGVGSGFTNEIYIQAGAKIVASLEETYQIGEMILKVKEPIEREYGLIRGNHLLFTYFHFASSEVLTQAMIQQKAVCIAYETVETSARRLPLLIPMSEVAGRMATQEGAKYLEKTYNGRGILLGGVPGVAPAKVLVLGGGVVGTQAAKIAAGFGANVVLMDTNLDRLRYLSEVMPANVTTIIANELNIRNAIKNSDLIIGAVLIPGAKAPKLITRDMLKLMRPGTVMVDVAVDQGGCFETTHPTTHEHPTFMVDEVVHYCVANMPGAVPFTSTIALTNATLPYALQLANLGWKTACSQNLELQKGLNIVDGKVVYKGVSDAFGLPYSNVETVL